jgi:3-keto-disaccharide hydrolase
MLRTCVIYLLAAACLAGADNRLTPAERAADWRLLFDGATTEGWTNATGEPFPHRSWVIRDGCLVAEPRNLNPESYQDVMTTTAYGSFDLRFDWMIAPGGNSGVKYLVQKTDYRRNIPGHQRGTAARGFEMQLIDNERHPDAQRGSERTAGALYSLVAPFQSAAHPAGEFNTGRIVLRGTVVQHWINGVKVYEGDLDAPEIKRKLLEKNRRYMVDRKKRVTPLSFQHHGNLTMYRNIRILSLD